MPTARTALALAPLDGKIYAIGGTAVVQGPGLTTIEIYNPDSDTWTESPEMPTARVFLGAGTLANKIYAVGGVAEGLGPAILPTVEQFTPSGLSVTPLEKSRTIWGHIKNAD